MLDRGRQIAIVGVLVTTATVALWRQVEGESLTPYPDVGGVWTVCAGHTGPDVIPGVPWTQEQCDRVDWENLNRFGRAVVRCTDNAPLTRGQRDALTVFAGNVGEAAFCGSTLARKVREGDYPGGEAEFRRWVFYGCRSARGCQYSEGLFNRRVVELGRFKLPGTPAIYQEVS